MLDATNISARVCASYQAQCTYQLPSRGGLTLGTYGGIARDLLTFVADFWLGTGHWTAFVLSRQDTRGKTHGICNIAAILKTKDPDRVERLPKWRRRKR